MAHRYQLCEPDCLDSASFLNMDDAALQGKGDAIEDKTLRPSSRKAYSGKVAHLTCWLYARRGQEGREVLSALFVEARGRRR